MELTEAGKTFFICVAVLIVWSTILTKGWVARLARNNALGAIHPKDLKSKTSKQKNVQAQPVKSSKIQFAYLFAVVFSISALFFPFSYWVSMGIYNLSTKPTYSAKIVSYTSEWVETERTDSNNNRYTVEELRHTAQVTFTDKDNRTLTLDNSIRSTALPVVGKSIKIVYEDGDQRVVEKSIRSFLLYFAASFMLFIQGFVLVAIIAYGLNREMEPYIRFARFFIYRVVIPLGTMSMFAALVYVLFEYFLLGNPNDHPIWVVGICGFFALMLLPLIYHILSDWKLYKE